MNDGFRGKYEWHYTCISMVHVLTEVSVLIP